MTLVYTIRTVVGIMGNVIAFGLFMSPLPTFYKIIRLKDTEQFSGVPYVATLLNCLLWTLYGLPFVTPNSLLVVTINGIGTALESTYLCVYLFYAPNKPRAKVLKMLAVVLTFFAAVALMVMTITHVHKTRQLIVGVLCVIVGTGMYASPMSVMKLVIQTKSVKYMPFLLSLTAFLNGLTWTAYAFLGKIDPFIVVPNAIGTCLATTQLILYAIYSKKEKATIKNKENGNGADAKPANNHIGFAVRCPEAVSADVNVNDEERVSRQV
ncbi:bidirectional sugar transporter SWEET5 [Selaginella moellendorffii]|uniref:bidirectional sugar transporter SWEET5 n=1 Tax=Selaginella moellendorffii TaxID=88036 RepID=UPI000D1CA797|nr:bidirectional sugar transporter SWEET5 [Selaginella moellendorffii]|eukprot:XP_024532884.1 bidirectional sugar transporter SWEET5 [Selaginella moellendorffii]